MPATRKQSAGSAYRSPLRASQAAQTRTSVLEAASRLFAERGWSATTMAAIAREAGTAVETVYAGFGSKSGVLTAAIDAAIVGDDAPIPLAERPAYAQLGVGSVRERLAAAARVIAGAHERSVALLRAMQEAAASDQAARTRADKYENDRRAEIDQGLRLIAGRRVSARLVDAVWALTAPEVFTKLVVERGWTTTEYERWLVTTVEPMIRESPKR
jgi:AcrR family transcriptional regulator